MQGRFLRDVKSLSTWADRRRDGGGEERLERELGREKQIQGLEVGARRPNQKKGSVLEIHQVTGEKDQSKQII